jgi:hypothetical protein
MTNIVESLLTNGNTIPIQFIRYNPHKYKIDNNTIRTSQKERHSELIKTIYTTLFNTPLSLKYLFYDKDNNNKPTIFNNPEYNETFKQFYLH